MGRMRDKLCEFSGKRYLRWFGHMEERYLIEHIGEPLTFFLPVYIDTPKCIVQRLFSHAHLRCQSLFTQMLKCTTQLKILREIILPVYAEHGLSGLSIIVIALAGGTYRCTGIDQTLVEDRHLTR